MVWLPVFEIFNVCTDVDACDCTQGLCRHLERVCTGSLPCHTWDSNLHISIAPGFPVGLSTRWAIPPLLYMFFTYSRPSVQINFVPETDVEVGPVSRSTLQTTCSWNRGWCRPSEQINIAVNFAYSWNRGEVPYAGKSLKPILSVMHVLVIEHKTALADVHVCFTGCVSVTQKWTIKLVIENKTALAGVHVCFTGCVSVTLKRNIKLVIENKTAICRWIVTGIPTIFIANLIMYNSSYNH